MRQERPFLTSGLLFLSLFVVYRLLFFFFSTFLLFVYQRNKPDPSHRCTLYLLPVFFSSVSPSFLFCLAFRLSLYFFPSSFLSSLSPSHFSNFFFSFLSFFYLLSLLCPTATISRELSLFFVCFGQAVRGAAPRRRRSFRCCSTSLPPAPSATKRRRRQSRRS